MEMRLFMSIILAITGIAAMIWSLRRALAILDALRHIEELKPIYARVTERRYAGKGSYTLRVQLPTGEIRTLSMSWLSAAESGGLPQPGEELPVLVHRRLTLPYREPPEFWLLLQLMMCGLAILIGGLTIAVGALTLSQLFSPQ